MTNVNKMNINKATSFPVCEEHKICKSAVSPKLPQFLFLGTIQSTIRRNKFKSRYMTNLLKNIFLTVLIV